MGSLRARGATRVDLNGPQDLLVRESQDAHLERNPRGAAEDFVRLQYFLRGSLGIADQQRPRGSVHGVELCPRRRGQPRSLPISVKVCAISRMKIVGCLRGGVSQEADGVKTHDEFLSRVTGAAACLAVELNKRPESFWRSKRSSSARMA